jgi:hypothetical protein
MHTPYSPPEPRLREPSASIQRLLGLIAMVAILLPALIVHLAPPVRPYRHVRPPMAHVIPPSEIPPVEAVAYQDLAPDDARAFNAQVPFTTDPVPPAHPFKLVAPPIDRARAIDCLAAAVLYEAGDDAVGERAVAQVVLNRLRHPAFPKTVCGVVFEGSERRSGCQFTFTCDGALIRHNWSTDAWARARLIAEMALNGAVFAKVGYATHYHTDWVVPYWSASLDKVSAVGTHLFYRWTGWWGTPGAFRRSVGGFEPIVPMLAGLSAAHADGATLADVATPQQRAAALIDALTRPPPSVPGDTNSFLVTIDGPLSPDEFPQLAAKSCGQRPYCKFMAWDDVRITPKRLPLEPYEVAAMVFSYFRDRGHGFDKSLWNCRVFARADPTECMKTQTFQPAPLPREAPIPPAVPLAPRVPEAPGTYHVPTADNSSTPSATRD